MSNLRCDVDIFVIVAVMLYSIEGYGRAWEAMSEFTHPNKTSNMAPKDKNDAIRCAQKLLLELMRRKWIEFYHGVYSDSGLEEVLLTTSEAEKMLSQKEYFDWSSNSKLKDEISFNATELGREVWVDQGSLYNKSFEEIANILNLDTG